MKIHFRSFFKQNTGNFKTKTLLTGSHNFSAIGLKQFHKKSIVKSSDDNWDLLRVPNSNIGIHLLIINCNITSSEASLPIFPNIAAAR